VATVFRDPNLPDYFEELDCSAAGALKALIPLYEDEKVILLRNRRIEFDPTFFASFQLPGTRDYKKFKAFKYVEEYAKGHDLYPSLAADCFGGDRKRAAYLREQLVSILRQVEALLNEAGGAYKIARHGITYRGSATFNENLHIDVYKEEIPTHHFRVFVNLDCAHRIWHTSWRLSDILRTRLAELPRKQLETMKAGDLNKALNFHVFGGRSGFYEDLKQPRHVAFFEPGEVWFVDSRTVAHQIFYGRQAVSSESVVERQNMADPARHYLARTDARRQELLCPA
jgi:hypothetical protein